tara:strand:- start:819 stop:2009 length:1191 start_codon:yes stop_codon:yes gene_type:complete
MKRVNGLFHQICSFKNLHSAWKKAQKGKRLKKSVLFFNFNLERELIQLQEELLAKTYKPGKYTEFSIYERKPRKISAAPFRDRVVHHALINIVEPIFEKKFIFDSYACRVGKGTHSGVNRYCSFLIKNKYALKCDIKKYFPSIDREILKEKIRKKIKDKDCLWLFDLIIDSGNSQLPIADYFPGDDLFTPYERRKGIPIGNLTSQFFANVYLNDLDHFVKESLHCRYYIRYVDDFVFLDNDKKKLRHLYAKVIKFLEKDRLKISHEKTIITPVSEGIDLLGYRIFPDYRKVRKDNAFRFMRKLRRFQKMYNEWEVGWDDINPSVQSWIGHATHANTYHLREKIFNSIAFTRGAGKKKVLRGGSWNNKPKNLRATNRNRNKPDKRNNNNGFRIAQDT